MTVLDNTPRDQYTATASQTVFPYTFEIAAIGDIKVLQNGVLINQGAGAGEYGVSGVGVDTGGNVTLVTGATAGDVLTLYRDMALNRLTSYNNAGDFLAADVNNDFDRLWLALQQNTGNINRALVAPDSDPTNIDMTIPDKAARLDKLLKFNVTTGNPEVISAADALLTGGFNVYNFTGTGAAVAFTLGQAPGGENNTQVYIDGVYQQKDTYSVSSTTLTFSTAPPNLSTIEVMVIDAYEIGSTTAAQVSFTQSGSTHGSNVQLKLEESISVKDFGAIGDGATDDTIAIQAAHDTGGSVFYPDGTYLLTDEISLSSSASVILMAGVVIEQTTDNKSVFKATSKTNIDIQCGSALFKGKGAYSAAWTGNSGHLDRVIAIIDCTKVSISNARTQNGSNAGIYIEGSIDVIVDDLTVEGTHSYGVPISSGDNFQNGIYIKHSLAHGNCQNVQINNFNVTGTAQGILLEHYSTYTPGNNDNIVLNGVAHGIPGQHGAYLQAGNVNLSLIATDCELDGCKVQAGLANPDIKNFILDVNATNCGSHALEIQNAGTTGVASIANVIANVVARNCQRGLGINNDTSNMRATVTSEDSTQYGLIIQGTNNKDIDIDIVSTRSGRYGVYIDSVSATDITIRPKVREANTSSGAYSGIYVNSVGSLTLIDPEATDASSLQDYGLFVVAGDVWVKGKAVFTGTSTAYSARANVLLKDWPVDVTLDSTSIVSLLNIGNFGYSTGTNKQTAQTTSVTNVTMYQIPLDDESSVSIVADIACKLSDTTKRRYVRTAVLAYRDGGGATLEAAATTLSDIQTAGDTSAFLWEVSGNNLRLRVNSGAASTYDWQGEFEIIRI